MSEIFLNGRVTLHAGDCIAVMSRLMPNSVDSVVCDPPYHLTSIVKRFGADDAAPCKPGKTGAYARASAGFMGRKWDAPDAPAIDPGFAGWFSGFVDGEGCFHVHKKTVNNCETYDCQFSLTLRADDKAIIEDMKRQLGGIGSIAERPAPKAGNGKPQVRYCISSKADCQILREVLRAFPLRAKKRRDFEIWSDALDAWLDHEPGTSWEEIAYFREKLMAVRQYGAAYHPSQIFFYRFARAALRVLKPGGHIVAFAGTRMYHRLAAGVEDAGFEVRDMLQYLYGSGFPKSHNQGEGWGTALKPAVEPIILARKPLSEKTVAANVLQYGTGAINIDGCRVGTDDTRNIKRGGKNDFPNEDDAWTPKSVTVGSECGRWPANIIHDGSEEVLAAFPDAPGQQYYVGPEHGDRPSRGIYGDFGARPPNEPRNDSGSAARFFYTAKADADDRLGSKHPTVKPVDLMQWLCRLVTPPGGTVLDPFAGTGTTGEAAFREGFNAVLIEREPEYQADIRRRMALCMSGPDERARESIKAKTKDQPVDHGPLFAGAAE
ncbi:MAG: hypothetical protein JWR80_10039 [Bradyrhizobium sp.]|nr:hypothetical protein [Bradyrhizobium sp.]